MTSVQLSVLVHKLNKRFTKLQSQRAWKDKIESKNQKEEGDQQNDDKNA